MGQSLRVTLWGGLGDVLVERKTNHVGTCAVVLTAMSTKDYNNKLYLSSSSSTVIYDDDDIPCLQELKTKNSCIEPTKAVLAADCSLPKEGTLENLLIWARNCKNNLLKCSAESLMGADDERADVDDDSNLPTAIRNVIGTTHVLEIKLHTYYEYGTFESFTCWKINPSEPVEDGASSSTPTLPPNDAVPLMKRLSRHPTLCTPLKPNEDKKKRVRTSLIAIQHK
ncbi:hypothetical protein Tco_1013337 [Tanacetum coccineum]